MCPNGGSMQLEADLRFQSQSQLPSLVVQDASAQPPAPVIPLEL